MTVPQFRSAFKVRRRSFRHIAGHTLWVVNSPANCAVEIAIPELAVEALNERILRRLARLDEGQSSSEHGVCPSVCPT